MLLSQQAASDLGPEIVNALRLQYKIMTYGFDEANDIKLEIKGVEHGKVIFDFFSPMGSIESIASRMPGQHNVSNAAVAIAVALLLGKDKNAIANGVSTFKGVKRRFEWIVDGPKVYIDDYAHHPTELKMAIGAARMMFPGKNCWVFSNPIFLQEPVILQMVLQKNWQNSMKSFLWKFTLREKKPSRVSMLNCYWIK